MENTERQQQKLLSDRRKRFKWILLAVCLTALVLTSVLILVLVKGNDSVKAPALELTYRGVTLERGQKLDPEELAQRWGTEAVDPKELDPNLDFKDGTLVVQSETDSAFVRVTFLWTGSDYVIAEWYIGSGVEFCGLKPGDSMDDVREVFPGADYYFSEKPSQSRFLVFVDQEGNILTSAQMWKKWNEANAQGGGALEKLQEEYTQIEITQKLDGTIDSISVS